MHTRHQKLFTILRVTLLTILFSAVFHQPGVSRSSPDGPYDVFLPLLSKPYPPLPDILNGDFELGNNGDWTEYSSSDYSLIGPYIEFITPLPPSGTQLAWLGGINNEVASLSQAVTLPADGPVYLRYYYQVDSEKSACNADWMHLLVGMTELVSLGLCEFGNTTDWVAGTVDLNAYAGQTITIEFEVTTDPAADTSSFFIDDVSLVRSP